MGELFDVMHKFFTDEEWYFVQLDSKAILQMAYQGKNGRWTCYAQANDEQHLFSFFSVCPVNVPEEKRVLMAEFVTRATYGLKIGNFEMDFGDGEVRYRTSVDVENDRLTGALLSNLVYTNVITMDRYLPGILSVIYGDVTPLDAVKKVEG